jgi:hypothetical protein
MQNRKRIGVITACVVLVACGASELLGPDAPQGIDGLVLLGPMCPVQPLDDSCPDQPYQALIGVRSATGELVTRVRSGEDGRFRVGLEPGAYVIEPESGKPFPVAGPQNVVVEAGRYTEVLVSYDTGIR